MQQILLRFCKLCLQKPVTVKYRNQSADDFLQAMLELKKELSAIGNNYNQAVHKICARLRFCGKEPSDADKIEKTLQTMIPSDRVLQHQYRARNYQTYSELIHDLL